MNNCSRMLAVLAAMTVLAPFAAAAAPVTVLYDDKVVEVERTLPDADDLWVAPEDLPRVNGFELKPEGACLDELCVPVRQGPRQRAVRQARGAGLVQRDRTGAQAPAGVRGRP